MAPLPDTPPQILARAEHEVSRSVIHTNALKVLYRLNRGGHKAYLVGGAVRDLMLGRTPKDYDIATSARPPQIRRLFRNSRIIGRRFRLAHIYFKEGIIEVATFRRNPDPEAQGADDGELLITDDNVFGSPREDAFRRDFTANALFYNIGDYSIIDYVGGIEDLKLGLIRSIGDAEVRFREDPVRMMRACEIAARLGFSIERESQEAIQRVGSEIEKASPARLTEELLQLLRCGHAGAAFQWMVDLELARPLLPEIYAMIGSDYSGLLPVIDRFTGAGREMSEIGLLTMLLYPAVRQRQALVERERRRPLGDRQLEELAAQVIEPFFRRFVLSKLKAEQVARTVVARRRLAEPDWKTVDQVRFAGKPYFDDALLLAEALERAGDREKVDLDSWRRVVKHRPKRPAAAARRPRRRRRRRGQRTA